MELTNTLNISSLDSKISNTDNQIPKQDIKADSTLSKHIPIDEKFIDNISIKKDSTIEATVIKADNGKYTLELSNGKNIEVKLPIELKPLDKVVINIENSQIKTIQVKDLVQQANINKNDLIKIIQALNLNSSIIDIKNNKIPLNLESFKQLDQSIQSNILKNLNLNINLNKSSSDFLQVLNNITDSNILPEAKLSLENFNITTNTQNQIESSLPAVKNIEFKDFALKVLINAINKASNNESSELDLKVIKQDSNTTIQTSLNDKIKLDITLLKPENIINRFITINSNDETNKLNTNSLNNNIIKTDTNNQVQSIKVSPETLKNLIAPLTSEINKTLINKKQLLPINNNQQVAANNLHTNTIKSYNINIIDNKAIIPELDNLTIKLPIKTAASNENIPLNNIDKPQLIIKESSDANKVEISIRINSNETIKLENADIELSSKEVNKVVESLLQQSTVSQLNNNKILLKSPGMFEILLTVKNSLDNASQIKFELTNNTINLKTPDVEVNNINNSAQVNINKQSIPNLSNSIAPQLAFMLTSVIATSVLGKQADKDSDIFSLMLDSIPENYKPKLQASSNQNDSLKYFTFPYYQEDDILKNGQMTYQSHVDENNNKIYNLAIKVDFSKIGEVMLKIKNINKNITINIYTQININATNKGDILDFCKHSIAKSGFLGTVSIKKSESLNMPLLNPEEIVYSGINLKI